MSSRRHNWEWWRQQRQQWQKWRYWRYLNYPSTMQLSIYTIYKRVEREKERKSIKQSAMDNTCSGMEWNEMKWNRIHIFFSLIPRGIFSRTISMFFFFVFLVILLFDTICPRAHTSYPFFSSKPPFHHFKYETCTQIYDNDKRWHPHSK